MHIEQKLEWLWKGFCLLICIVCTKLILISVNFKIILRIKGYNQDILKDPCAWDINCIKEFDRYEKIIS